MSKPQTPLTGTAQPSPDKAELIKQDQAKLARKQHIMTAELVTIAPHTLLFNALSIAAQELARLQSLSVNNELSDNDFKKYAILIQALVKLSEENRLSKAQSYLENKSEEDIKLLVLKAIEALNE